MTRRLRAKASRMSEPSALSLLNTSSPLAPFPSEFSAWLMPGSVPRLGCSPAGDGLPADRLTLGPAILVGADGKAQVSRELALARLLGRELHLEASLAFGECAGVAFL